MKLFVIALAALLLGACASPRIMPVASQEEYIKMTPEERKAVDQEAKQVADAAEAWWKNVGEVLYKKHQPVTVGTEGARWTMQWHSLPGDYDAVTVYPGYNPPGMNGNNSEGMYTALADKQGNILYAKGAGGIVSPNRLLANVTTDEDFGRLVARGVLQIGSAASNGLLGQIYRTERGCDGGNCGGGSSISLTNVGGVSTAASGATAKSESATDATIDIGGLCPGCKP